jgi:cyclophilin family peptidyl-prolyl cis-trans isomerase/HEAT repeat protein
MRTLLTVIALSLQAVTASAWAPAAATVDARARALALLDARRFDAAALGELARDPAAEVRIAAAAVLGGSANPAAVPLLAALARDRDAQVRAAAAEACGRLSSLLTSNASERGGCAKLLQKLLQDSATPVRAAAAWGIGAAAPQEGELWLLHRLARDPDATVRAAILQELWRFPDTLWIKRAAPFAADRDLKVRMAAVWSLSRSDKVEAVPALRRAAHDAETLVRVRAVMGLAQSKGGDFWYDFVAALGDPDARVRLAAGYGLSDCLEKDAKRTLSPRELRYVAERIADANPDAASERIRALRIAAAAKCCAEQLRPLVAAGRMPVAGEALVALVRQEPTAASRIIDEWLMSKDVTRRVAAARAAGRAPAEPNRLLGALRDEQARVRLAAVEVLSHLQGSERALGAAVGDADAAVRAAAVQALVERKAAPPPADLLALLAKEDGAKHPDAAVAIVNALAAQTPWTAEIQAALERLAGGADAVVARAAWEALRAKGMARPLPVVATGQDGAFYRKVITWAATPRWLELITVRGTLEVALDTRSAPLTCYRLAELVEKKFFDGLIFHRVVNTVVVQGGDPRGDGWGGPDFVLRDELSLAPFDTDAVGIALAGPDTGGSQFFVTLAPQPRLLGRYPYIGRLSAGDEVARRLQVGDRIVRAHVGEGPPPEYFPIWYGMLDPARLEREIAGWRDEADRYHPKEEWLERLRSAKLKYGIVVAMGTWCDDSREQVPRLQAILRALGERSPFETPRLIGIDRSKTIEFERYPYGSVERVPTMVVTSGGQEIGRIVETPASGCLEEDLVRMLAPIEGWELPSHE